MAKWKQGEMKKSPPPQQGWRGEITQELIIFQSRGDAMRKGRRTNSGLPHSHIIYGLHQPDRLNDRL